MTPPSIIIYSFLLLIVLTSFGIQPTFATEQMKQSPGLTEKVQEPPAETTTDKRGFFQQVIEDPIKLLVLVAFFFSLFWFFYNAIKTAIQNTAQRKKVADYKDQVPADENQPK